MRGLVFVIGLHAGAGDHWFGADKVKHFFMSAFVESVSYSALRAAHVRHDPALIAASTLTLGVGVGKELYDHHSYGLFSVKDLTWDIAGNGAAAAVLAHTR
jgi:putative lipoprotein